MFNKNNNFSNQNNILNYYPDDNNFFKNENLISHNNINFETLFSILNNNTNPMDLIKTLTSNNPQLSQIINIMSAIQSKPTKTKKTTTKLSDCKYISVKDYYNSKKEDS